MRLVSVWRLASRGAWLRVCEPLAGWAGDARSVCGQCSTLDLGCPPSRTTGTSAFRKINSSSTSPRS